MSKEAFTPAEAALLDALQSERELHQQRELLNGILLHEMANAVTIIAAGAEILRDRGEDRRKRDFAVSRLGSGVRVLTDLLANVRWMMGLEGVPPTRETVHLGEVVRGVVHDPALMSESGAARVTIEERGNAGTSEVCVPLLRPALGNLLRNALAYSPPGTPVRVIVTLAPAGEAIHVVNYGAPLPAGFAERAFEPGKKSSCGGMGFGLYIVRLCMRRSGGEVVFGSTRAATVFSLRLNRPPSDGVTHPEFLLSRAVSA